MTPCARRTLLLAATLAVAGCGDAPTEPGAVLVAKETRAALQVSEALPTLPALLARTRLEEEARPGRPPAPDAVALERAFGLWLDAQGAHAGDAEVLMADAWAAAAPVLARRLGADGFAGAVADARRWVALARPLVGAYERPGLRAALESGQALLDASEGHAAAADTVAAVRALLGAAERLRQTTPRAVSGVLVGEAEAALEARAGGPIDPSPSPSDELAVTLARVQRLLHHARAARDEGDYPLAIQRAYYAGQLLERLP